MRRLLMIVTNGFVVLAIYLTIILGLLVAIEMEPVTAQILNQQPEVTIEQESHPAGIINPASVRDITKQRFAPLE